MMTLTTTKEEKKFLMITLKVRLLQLEQKDTLNMMEEKELSNIKTLLEKIRKEK